MAVYCRKTNTNQEILSRLRKQQVYLISAKKPLVSTLGLFLPESGCRWSLARLEGASPSQLGRDTPTAQEDIMPDTGETKTAAPKERRL